MLLFGLSIGLKVRSSWSSKARVNHCSLAPNVGEAQVTKRNRQARWLKDLCTDYKLVLTGVSWKLGNGADLHGQGSLNVTNILEVDIECWI